MGHQLMASMALGLDVMRSGGDGLSAYHALLYKDGCKLNLAVWYDWSHGACRDVEAAFRKAAGQGTQLTNWLRE